MSPTARKTHCHPDIEHVPRSRGIKDMNDGYTQFSSMGFAQIVRNESITGGGDHLYLRSQVKVKLKFTLQQAMEAHRGSRNIAVLSL